MENSLKVAAVGSTATERELEQRLKELFLDGMRSGSESVCRIVLDALRDPSKSKSQKLKTLSVFCERTIEEMEMAQRLTKTAKSKADNGKGSNKEEK